MPTHEERKAAAMQPKPMGRDPFADDPRATDTTTCPACGRRPDPVSLLCRCNDR